MSGDSSCFVQLSQGFFTQYGKHLSPLMLKKNIPIPFKNHSQLPILVDILSRKDSHHACLYMDFAPKMYVYFLEALLQHLSHEHMPQHLRETDLIYIDLSNASVPKTKQKSLEKDFDEMHEFLDHSDKYLMFALSNMEVLTAPQTESEDGFLARQLTSLIAHPKSRFLLLTSAKERNLIPSADDRFTSLHINGPSDNDIMTILKQVRADLEDFHHVLIPEEILTFAYTLSERFLSTTHTLDKALQLLDSSAARASASERIEDSNQFKPVLSTGILTSVLSGWTQVPSTHLLAHKFKYQEFMHYMQQKIYGQDAAITLLGQELQRSLAHLERTAHAPCSLLFTGPKHSGKHAVAIALAEQLYHQVNVLYFTKPNAQPLQSLADIKLQRCEDNQFLPLKEVISHTPHAIIMLDNIDQATPVILDGILEIVSTGYLHDNGNRYDFRHALLILETTVGTNRLIELTNEFNTDEDEESGHGVDLLQLVMSEQKRETNATHNYTPQEIADEILPEIASFLPAALCQHLYIVPFVLLNKTAVEKIVSAKLNLLSNMLDSRHGIEFGYATEVVNYLANEVIRKQDLDPQEIDIESALKPLYFTVDQALFSQIDNKNRPNQLFLQLNETGQLLRCDWLAGNADSYAMGR